MPRAGGGSRSSHSSTSHSSGHRTSSSHSSSHRSSSRPSTQSYSRPKSTQRPAAFPPPPCRPIPTQRTVVHHHIHTGPVYRESTRRTYDTSYTPQESSYSSRNGSYLVTGNEPTEADIRKKKRKETIVKILVTVAVLALFIFLMAVFIKWVFNVSESMDKMLFEEPGQTSYSGDSYTDSDYMLPQVQKADKLDASLCEETDYYSKKTDKLGYFSDDVLSGMEYFYDKTGIQPYVMTEKLSNVDKYDDKALEDLYLDLFDDEGHFLLIIFGDKDGYEDWEYSWVIGNDAEKILDDDAMEVLWWYIDEYYSTDMSDDELISSAFHDATDKIVK